MKRLSMLLVLSLLLPAFAARAGDDTKASLERQLQAAQEKLVALQRDLEQAQDPRERARLEQKVALARAKCAGLNERLAAAEERAAATQALKARVAQARALADQALKRAEDAYAALEATRAAAERSGAAEAQEAARKAIEEVAAVLGQAYSAQTQALQAQETLERGDLAKVRDLVDVVTVMVEDATARLDRADTSTFVLTLNSDDPRPMKPVVVVTSPDGPGELTPYSGRRSGREEAPDTPAADPKHWIEVGEAALKRFEADRNRIAEDRRRLEALCAEAAAAFERAMLARERVEGSDLPFVEGSGEEADAERKAEAERLDRYLAAVREVNALLERARKALDAGRYDEAREAYEKAKARLAEAQEPTTVHVTGTATKTLRVVTDGSGRFHVEGIEEGPLVFHGRVVDEDGRVLKGTRVTTVGVDPRGRIEHLRQAARHLREAGHVEEAERLEVEAREMEERMARPEGGGEMPDVLHAIRGLTEEVRALRREVQELKALIRQGR